MDVNEDHRLAARLLEEALRVAEADLCGTSCSSERPTTAHWSSATELSFEAASNPQTHSFRTVLSLVLSRVWSH